MDEGHYTTMAEALADVPDPRCRRGVRYPWRLLVVLVAAAMLSGQQHGRAIAQRVREHADTLAGLLQPDGGRLPSESTLRRTLRDVDVAQLEVRLARFAAGLDALDGVAVLVQAGVGAKENEIAAAPRLLSELDLSGTVTTVFVNRHLVHWAQRKADHSIRHYWLK